MESQPGTRGSSRALTPSAQTAALIRRAGHPVTLDKGTEVFAPGGTVSAVPLVVEGRVRVYTTTETGGEITLYEIDRGQVCVLAAAGALTGREYPATAVTETRATVLMVPAAEFLRLFGQEPEFRRSVFDLLTGKLATVMGLVTEVAFQPMEARVAAYIRRRADADGLVNETHEEIATHLGTAREVVSRILKGLEARGLVALGRGRVRVTDGRGLAAAAQGGE